MADNVVWTSGDGKSRLSLDYEGANYLLCRWRNSPTGWIEVAGMRFPAPGLRDLIQALQAQVGDQ